jgi:hypothetical protein
VGEQVVCLSPEGMIQIWVQADRLILWAPSELVAFPVEQIIEEFPQLIAWLPLWANMNKQEDLRFAILFAWASKLIIILNFQSSSLPV